MEKAEEFEKNKEENKDDPKSTLILSKRELLPDFNLDAQRPEQVYNFNSSIVFCLKSFSHSLSL